MCSNRGLGQIFHVTQRRWRRRLSGDLTQKAGRKQMAGVVDGRCSHGLAGWPGDITGLQTPPLSPASQGINKLIRPAAHMGSQSRAAVLSGCYWSCWVCLKLACDVSESRSHCRRDHPTQSHFGQGQTSVRLRLGPLRPLRRLQAFLLFFSL